MMLALSGPGEYPRQVSVMKKTIRNLARRFGVDIVPYRGNPFCDLSETQRNILARVRPFTMTSVERIAALIHAVDHIAAQRIPGDIAECGVWRGGSMMAAALTLLDRGDTSRTFYLYDTFDGMSPPTELDKTSGGEAAVTLLAREAKGGGTWANGIWCYASMEDVRANLMSTGYPESRIRLVKGKVEDTLPSTLPGPLAILRLDTDWYASTKHELTHLFPLLTRNGVMIVDDYGDWQGARKAVDEYFRERDRIVYLHRIDHTGRLMVNG